MVPQRPLATVVYESMFGNTHAVAEAIAAGLRDHADVDVQPVAHATPASVAAATLLVVGGPTHVHGLSRRTSRAAAVAQAAEPERDLVLDPDADGPGLRDWFDGLAPVSGTLAAAFDTRIDAPAALTGRAARAIGRRLRRHGYCLVEAPESFLVDKEHQLLPDERERAVAWGRTLAQSLLAGAGAR